MVLFWLIIILVCMMFDIIIVIDISFSVVICLMAVRLFLKMFFVVFVSLLIIGGDSVSYHVSLGYSTLMYLIQDMTAELAPTVEIILYDYLRCWLIEYNEFLALMETYRFRCHELDAEVS